VISLLLERTVPDHINNQVDLVRWAKQRGIIPRNSINKPKDLKDGEYAVPMINRDKKQVVNPATGRLKKKKITKYLKTDIAPEDRTLKNLPRDGKKKPKVKFQDWLQLKKPAEAKTNYSVGKAANGKWYGWSHRAIHGFAVGDIIKPDMIGNKYEYSKDVNKKYNQIEKTKGTEAAENYHKSLAKFKPYKIKTDKEAMEHAIRFARDVS